VCCSVLQLLVLPLSKFYPLILYSLLFLFLELLFVCLPLSAYFGVWHFVLVFCLIWMYSSLHLSISVTYMFFQVQLLSHQQVIMLLSQTPTSYMIKWKKRWLHYTWILVMLLHIFKRRLIFQSRSFHICHLCDSELILRNSLTL